MQAGGGVAPPRTMVHVHPRRQRRKRPLRPALVVYNMAVRLYPLIPVQDGTVLRIRPASMQKDASAVESFRVLFDGKPLRAEAGRLFSRCSQSMASCRTNLGSLYGECRINWRLPRGWEMNSPIISRLSLQGGVPALACQGFRMHASAVKSSHGRHGRKQERVDTTVLSELTENSPSMPLAAHCMTKCKRSLDKLLFVACCRRETETLVRAKAEGTHRRTWKPRVVQLYIDA